MASGGTDFRMDEVYTRGLTERSMMESGKTARCTAEARTHTLQEKSSLGHSETAREWTEFHTSNKRSNALKESNKQFLKPRLCTYNGDINTSSLPCHVLSP